MKCGVGWWGAEPPSEYIAQNASRILWQHTWSLLDNFVVLYLNILYLVILKEKTYFIFSPNITSKFPQGLKVTCMQTRILYFI